MDLAWAEPSFSMYEMEDAIEDLQVRLFFLSGVACLTLVFG